MGVKGLLPFLQKAQSQSHIRKFSGCTAAVDVYGWLHKGAFGCAVQLGKGEATTAYITYCVKYLNVLLDHNVKPVVVLDGRNLPSKAETEKNRREKREENRKKARNFLRQGKNKEAWECFTKCVDITPAMARQLIKVLREMKIDYVVAPYEADAQLAYLAKNQLVDIVITEDSDLILFGCPKIFFKMSVEGHGVLFNSVKIPQCIGVKPSLFEFQRFRWMCILSGCDYLASLPGIGLGRAKKIIEAADELDIQKIIMSIPKFAPKVDISCCVEYSSGFIQADNTFLYQIVFDTVTKEQVPLTPYPPGLSYENLKFAGEILDKEVAVGLALGNIDLHSLEVVDNFDICNSKSGYPRSSIWINGSSSFSLRSLSASIPSNSNLLGMQSKSVVISKGHKKKSFEEPSSSSDAEKTDNLLSMYLCKNSDSSSTDTSVFKRKRESNIDFEHEEENETEQSPRKLLRRKNPFLKTSADSSKPVSILRSNVKSDSSNLPKCLVEKNKVYSNKRIIVKSKYFRKDNEVNYVISGTNEKLTSSIKKSSSELPALDSSSEIETDPEESTMDSQLTIYSVKSSEGSSDNNNDKTDQPNSQFSISSNQSDLENNTPPLTDDVDEMPLTPEEVNDLLMEETINRKIDNEESPVKGNSYEEITLEDDSPVKLRYSVSPALARKIEQKISPLRTESEWHSSAFRKNRQKSPAHKKSKLKLGMSKSALRRADPKQKTLSSMFGFKSKN